MDTFKNHVSLLATAMDSLSPSESMEFAEFERILSPDTTSFTVVSGR